MIKRKTSRRRVRGLLLAGLLVALLIAGGVGVRALVMRERLERLRAHGIAATKAQRHEQAIQELSFYLYHRPRDTNAAYHFALSRRRVEAPTGDHLEQALAALRTVLMNNPRHLEAMRLRMAILLDAGRHDEALQACDALLAVAADDEEALSVRATLLKREGRMDEARLALEKLVTVAPQRVDGHLRLLTLLAAKDMAAMNLQARAGATALRDPGAAALVRAVALRLSGSAQAARAWLIEAAGHRPMASSVVLPLVEQLDLMLMFDEADRVLADAASGEDSLRSAWIARLLHRGAYSTLLAQTRGSESVEDHAYRVWALWSLGEPAEQSLAWLGAWVEREARDWAVMFEARLASDRDPASLALARRLLAATETLLARRPECAGLWSERGVALQRLLEPELAVESYRRATQAAPIWTQPYRQSARLLLEEGDLTMARKLAAAALQRSPDDPDSLVLCADLLVEQLARGEVEGEGALKALVGRLPAGEASFLARGVVARPDAAAWAAWVQGAGGVTPAVRLRAARYGVLLGAEQARALWRSAVDEAGLTPEAALMDAELAESPTQGLTRLREHVVAAQGQQNPAWQAAAATYLSRIGDPKAAWVWLRLAMMHPDDERLHRLALNRVLSPVMSEQPYESLHPAEVRRLIHWVEATSGDAGIAWRIATARWSLRPQADPQELAEAAVILNKAVRLAPMSATVRELQRRVLERLDESQEGHQEGHQVGHQVGHQDG